MPENKKPKEIMRLEDEFKKWMWDKKTIICGKNYLQVLGYEVPLFNPMVVLTEGMITIKSSGWQNLIGKIDLIIRYRQKNYVVETKYIKPTESIENFWGAIKSLAYCVYYKWQTDLTRKEDFYPAIFVPEKSIRLEHKIIAGKLGITIFGIRKVGDGWIVEFIQ